MPTKAQLINDKAFELIKNSPQGLRYSQLSILIKETYEHISLRTIQNAIVKLDITFKDKIYKADRGLFRHISFKEKDVEQEIVRSGKKSNKIAEEDFYQPFADYLTNDLEECSRAISLGRNVFKEKWGTPDVIGIKKCNRSDIIKFEEIVVSAEIKIDSAGLITAFGQACAYKIFSHKVYIVIPRESSEEDKSRIESLCLIFGIGLILFDNHSPEKPQFEIRVRPFKHEPDMFYVNLYMKRIEDKLFY